jgi:hypothetical protein
MVQQIIAFLPVKRVSRRPNKNTGSCSHLQLELVALGAMVSLQPQRSDFGREQLALPTQETVKVGREALAILGTGEFLSNSPSQSPRSRLQRGGAWSDACCCRRPAPPESRPTLSGSLPVSSALAWASRAVRCDAVPSFPHLPGRKSCLCVRLASVQFTGDHEHLQSLPWGPTHGDSPCGCSHCHPRRAAASDPSESASTGTTPPSASDAPWWGIACITLRPTDFPPFSEAEY